MGLDIHVGPLCRYYMADWEIWGEQTAKLHGWPYTLMRAGPPLGRAIATSSENLRPFILDWRRKLRTELGDNVLEASDWIEDPRGPYFTDKPGSETTARFSSGRATLASRKGTCPPASNRERGGQT